MGAIDNFLPGDTHVYEYVFRRELREPLELNPCRRRRKHADQCARVRFGILY